MSLCPHCGKNLIQNASFCPYCKEKLNVKKDRWKSFLKIVLGIIVVIGVLFGLMLLYSQFSFRGYPD